MKLPRSAYEELIAGNLEWLSQQPRTLERDHIEMIVKASPTHEYGETADLRRDRDFALRECDRLNAEVERLRLNFKTSSEQLFAAEAKADKGDQFKAYVHGRLDRAGVPADPEPAQNATHGCRIEGRLNFLLGQLDAANQQELVGVTKEMMSAALVSRDLVERAFEVLVDESVVLRDAVARSSTLLREALGR